MKFKTEPVGHHLELRKGLSYKGSNLVDEAEVGLLTIDAFITGGGYKRGSEKPYEGDYKSEHIAEPGDVLLAMTEQQDGLLASPLKVPDDLGGMGELVFSLDVAKVIPTSGEVAPEYLFNFLRVPLNRRRAAYGDSGTTVQRLPYDVIYEQMIPVPSLVEQDRINSFIATLDRKVELNTAMAATIEQIAKTIFRSWFIDFDPVKAKMAGKVPVGMDHSTAALFPNSMEDSKFGPIPQGWRLKNLGEVCDIKQGRYLAPHQMTTSPVEFSDVPVIGGNGVLGYTNKSTFEHDVTLITCRGSKCGLLQWGKFPSWISNNAMAVTMKFSPEFGQYLYWAFKHADFDSVITGSAQPQITITNLSLLELLVPSVEILSLYSRIVNNFRSTLNQLEIETCQLTEVRDSLLPRLISGELQIPEEMMVS